MNVSWIKSEREQVGSNDPKKGFVPRLGKNGGPIYKQNVVKVFSPR